jgi:hypothetical protein
VRRLDTCILSAFVGYLLLDGWKVRTNALIVAHHVFTVAVYGACILSRRAIHMGRLILVNEVVTLLNALRRLGVPLDAPSPSQTHHHRPLAYESLPFPT